MEQDVRFGLFVVTALVCLTFSSPSALAATHIYLLKGFANVFSTGLDSLADALVAHGYKAETYNHMEAGELAVEAAKQQKADKGAVIIIGHSLGADAAVSMAEAMKQEGANVLLLVTFGPDYRQAAPSNVANVLNYYQGKSIIVGGRGFKGTIINVNLNKSDGINHFNVEKIERLHAKVIAKIQALTRSQPTSGRRSPAASLAR
jgi:hypothetical protein